eukprot:102742-Amphidinium_carterae.1
MPITWLLVQVTIMQLLTDQTPPQVCFVSDKSRQESDRINEHCAVVRRLLLGFEAACSSCLEVASGNCLWGLHLLKTLFEGPGKAATTSDCATKLCCFGVTISSSSSQDKFTRITKPSQSGRIGSVSIIRTHSSFLFVRGELSILAITIISLADVQVFKKRLKEIHGLCIDEFCQVHSLPRTTFAVRQQT